MNDQRVVFRLACFKQLGCIWLFWIGVILSAWAQNFSQVPGVVIDHLPKSTRNFIGSPSLVILPNGNYIASHDIFGKGPTPQHTHVFESTDRGKSWQKIAELDSLWWASLFINKGALYLFGTTREYGRMSIRRSMDGGRNWSRVDEGILNEEDGYHCASVPVQVFKGRVWKGMERNVPVTSWGNFQSFVASAPVDADLLDPKSWAFTPRLIYNKSAWGPGNAWLEGNVVMNPKGEIWNLLRVNNLEDDQAAMYRVSDDGQTADSSTVTFIKLPGACKKFNIRFDPKTKRYFTFTNYVLPNHRTFRRERARNAQVMLSSPNLETWTIHGIILYHPDIETTGFQYLDWQFDGNDIIVASRTAFDDGMGGADNQHNSNFLTFHRVKNFRTYRTPAEWRPLLEGITDFVVLK
ncbi:MULTISPECIES: sialidase family protein [unclassified Spirosoma]|uniref:sialidase family protein n=1 Tax=unclassified Spirosoma TaxID=2621999 RepID=UPI000AE05946|nr:MULTISPECIES: sialidase family protein [unclassified Spirosoma]